MKILHVQNPIARPILELSQLELFIQHFPINFNAVRPGRTLESIHRQVEQDLNEIGPMHSHADIAVQTPRVKLIVLQSRVHLDQMREIGQEMIDADARQIVGVLMKKTEIPL